MKLLMSPLLLFHLIITLKKERFISGTTPTLITLQRLFYTLTIDSLTLTAVTPLLTLSGVNSNHYVTLVCLLYRSNSHPLNIILLG